MKKQIVQSKNFKRSHKFLKAKTNISEDSISSKKNLVLKEKQFSAVTHKLIRNFKSEKFNSLVKMNKNLTKKSLGSKLGSGKGKFLTRTSMVRKYQSLITFKSKSRANKIGVILSKFTNFL